MNKLWSYWENLSYWKKGGFIGLSISLLGLLGVFEILRFMIYVNYLGFIINYAIFLIFMEPNEAYFGAMMFGLLSPIYYFILGVIIGGFIDKLRRRDK